MQNGTWATDDYLLCEMYIYLVTQSHGMDRSQIGFEEDTSEAWYFVNTYKYGKIYKLLTS